MTHCGCVGCIYSWRNSAFQIVCSWVVITTEFWRCMFDSKQLLWLSILCAFLIVKTQAMFLSLVASNSNFHRRSCDWLFSCMVVLTTHAQFEIGTIWLCLLRWDQQNVRERNLCRYFAPISSINPTPIFLTWSKKLLQLNKLAGSL